MLHHAHMYASLSTQALFDLIKTVILNATGNPEWTKSVLSASSKSLFPLNITLYLIFSMSSVGYYVSLIKGEAN